VCLSCLRRPERGRPPPRSTGHRGEIGQARERLAEAQEKVRDAAEQEAAAAHQRVKQRAAEPAAAQRRLTGALERYRAAMDAATGRSAIKGSPSVDADRSGITPGLADRCSGSPRCSSTNHRSPAAWRQGRAASMNRCTHRYTVT
jgi:hypothetical protein